MYNTQQEQYWQGNHGDDYTARNDDCNQISLNIAWLAKVCSSLQHFNSACEIGANVGYCLQALQALRPHIKLTGVEINQVACEQLEKKNGIKAICSSINQINITHEMRHDLVFTRALLIHISEQQLPTTYEKLYELSNRYILLCEYYNPTPVNVNYRGNHEVLQKRDFAGEMLDTYPLKLIDYGFLYHKDPLFPQDDLNWFLMEKE